MPSPTPPRTRTRPISLLPNVLTLTNAGLGLLAISKAIDALALAADQAAFERNLEAACWLVVLAGVFDVLDGKVARMTNSFSDLGAQLDSLADALTFGVAPAMIGKVLLERESVAHSRVHFAAVAVFALMALLRLARFNVETDEDDDHSEFRGLPSPAAAGMVVATVLLYLSVGGTIEVNGSTPTILGSFLDDVPANWREFASDTILLPFLLGLLPLLGLLMVSRVRYAHFGAQLGQASSRRVLIPLVLVVLGLFLIPTPILFLFGLYYVVSGLWRSARSDAKDDSDREKSAA